MKPPAPTPRWRRLRRADYATDPIRLAQWLLGARLVHLTRAGARVSGLIIETEAYLGVSDAAAHSFRGRRTARTEPMYGPPGTAYVYFTYGMHHCFNVVCGRIDEPVAVLIRAVAPREGLETMRRRRWGSEGRRGTDAALASGPGRLCQALAIDRRLSGADLTTHGRLFIERLVTQPSPPAAARVRNTPRIGVAYAGRWASRRLRWELALGDADEHGADVANA